MQKRLREKHNIDIIIYRSFSMDRSYHYEIVVNGEYTDNSDLVQRCIPNRSYEQALSDAIEKAITLIK